MDSSEGYQLLAGAFHVITDKIEVDILETAKKKNGIKNESLYVKDTFSERFQV